MSYGGVTYGGMTNVPGAPGNFVAGGLSFPIGPGKSDAGEEQQFKEMFKAPGSWRQYIKDYQRNNPLQRQMPSAGIGNVGGLLAQAQPLGGNIGSAALGGGMNMNMQQYMQQQSGGPSGPPITLGVDIENEKVKNLRGNLNAQLDANQSINLGGNYNVQNQSGQLGIGYRTPMFGFDVNVTRTPRTFNSSPGYGVQGNVTGRF